MPVYVAMPKWGLTMTEGKITRWLKAEGDPVQKGEPLFEVETSKITNVVEAPASGTLFQILVPAGQSVPVKTVVAVIAEPGEQPDRLAEGAPVSQAEEAASAARGAPPVGEGGVPSFVRASPIARRLAKEWGIDLAAVTGTGPEGRVTEQDVRAYKELLESGPSISPQARQLAEQAGIDLATIQGTGPGGRITKADVLRAVQAAKTGSAREETKPEQAPAPPGPGTILPFSGMRKAIADNMMASLQRSAQLTVFVEADVTDLIRLRDRLRARFTAPETPRLSLNDLIAYAVCRTLRKHPVMNSWLTPEGIVLHDHIHLGIAVALDDGLIVPNVKNAQDMPLMALAAAIKTMVAKARDGRLTLDDIQGGTFTITNVSMLGVDGFTPILNPPETAILGVGRAVSKPAVHEGAVTVRQLMTLSLTFDHRVTDGAPAMRFLRALADSLEDPATLIA